MSAYRPYPKYKPSGVEWLGDVPEEWEVMKLSFLAYLRSGESITAIDIEETGTYQVFGGNGPRGFTERHTHDGHFVLVGRQGALCGNVHFTSGKFWASEHALVANPLRKFNTKWFGEMLRAMNLSQYSVSAAQPGLSVENIGNLRLPVPSLPEQHQIASFLDRECGKLDALQAKQERLIELLKEKRQALISHAVTRGLDPAAKLKPSGIEWLGDVPEGWVAPYLGMLIAKAELGGNYDGSEGGDGIPLIKMGNLDRGFIKTNKVECLPEGQAYDRTFILKDGDFLFNTRNSLDLVGKVAVWRGELPVAIYNSNILRIAFRKQKVADSAFMSYFFNSDLGVSQLRLVAKGTTSVAAIYYKDLTTLRITLPPLAEQRAIVAHLDEKCGKIDQLKAKAERGIELLKERRSALISAAVTGKIDVRHT